MFLPASSYAGPLQGVSSWAGLVQQVVFDVLPTVWCSVEYQVGSLVRIASVLMHLPVRRSHILVVEQSEFEICSPHVFA